MFINRKPKLALLGLMLDAYESIFPGINDRQIRYVNEIIETLEPVADVTFSELGGNRESIERVVKGYNEADFDGMLIILLTYSNSTYLMRALQNNRLPLALCLVQPDQEIGTDWDELRLTVNQGIHGTQDNASMMLRCGFKCEYFVGNRTKPEFVKFVEDFGRACLADKRLKGMRTGVLSRMRGMGDTYGDELKFTEVIGPEYIYDTAGSLYSRMQAINKSQVDAQIERDTEIHVLDPKMTREQHEEAVRMYLGIKQWLEDNNLDAYTAQFDQFGDDGRFKQLPLYAASNLMADGYGYAAEGDQMCASMMAAAHLIAGGENIANFSEMYTMDFAKQYIIFCHQGEGNWACRKQGSKARLIDRYLGEGGLSNPPTFIFNPETGITTLVSLVDLGGGKYRLVCSLGEVIDKLDMVNCEMPYFFWRPNNGVEQTIENWLRNGGTHHEIVCHGDVRRRWEMWCNISNVEYVEV